LLILVALPIMVPILLQGHIPGIWSKQFHGIVEHLFSQSHTGKDNMNCEVNSWILCAVIVIFQIGAPVFAMTVYIYCVVACVKNWRSIALVDSEAVCIACSCCITPVLRLTMIALLALFGKAPNISVQAIIHSLVPVFNELGNVALQFMSMCLLVWARTLKLFKINALFIAIILAGEAVVWSSKDASLIFYAAYVFTSFLMACFGICAAQTGRELYVLFDIKVQAVVYTCSVCLVLVHLCWSAAIWTAFLLPLNTLEFWWECVNSVIHICEALKLYCCVCFVLALADACGRSRGAQGNSTPATSLVAV